MELFISVLSMVWQPIISGSIILSGIRLMIKGIVYWFKHS